MQDYNLADHDDNNQVIHVVNYDEPSPPRESQNEKEESSSEDENIEILSQDPQKLNVIEIEPEYPDRLITADNR